MTTEQVIDYITEHYIATGEGQSSAEIKKVLNLGQREVNFLINYNGNQIVMLKSKPRKPDHLETWKPSRVHLVSIIKKLRAERIKEAA